MSIQYQRVMSKKQEHRVSRLVDGVIKNVRVVFPPRPVIKVLYGKTIWNLRQNALKNRAAEIKAGDNMAKRLKAGVLKISGTEVVEPDPYGVEPDRPIGISGRIRERLKKFFGS